MRTIRVGMLALALGLSACGSGSRVASPVEPCRPTRILRAGDRLPDCSFVNSSGGTLRLADVGGKPLILNFWASWCVACVKEMPAFQRAHVAFGPRLQIVGMDALGVNGETESFARRFVSARGVSYPVAFDRDALLYANFAGAAARPILPLTVFVRPGGIVALVTFGELTAPDVTEKIRTLFNIA